jgi:hypothetical protein
MNDSHWHERRRLAIAHAPDEKYEEFVDRWAKEIGRFILAFGSIEYTTYMALQTFPRDPIGDPTSKLQLGDRIELLLAILEVRMDANSPRFCALLREVKGLIDGRNLVAHNSVGLDIYVNYDESDFDVVESIRSPKRPDKHLRIEKLVENRKRAEQLARDLHQACDAIRYSAGPKG